MRCLFTRTFMNPCVSTGAAALSGKKNIVGEQYVIENTRVLTHSGMLWIIVLTL